MWMPPWIGGAFGDSAPGELRSPRRRAIGETLSQREPLCADASRQRFHRLNQLLSATCEMPRSGAARLTFPA